MSEGEYQYQEELCSDAGLEDLPPRALETPPGEWRTRDGTILQVRAMSVEHIRNAISLFERSGWGDHAKILELRLELARRGE
jgi:hypothetical protein